jgi:chromosome segregation ATPase
MAAFYDFGPVLEPAGDSAAGDSSGEGDIEVDNTLGTETPRFEAFLAIIGAGVPGEGVTFVELPSPAAASGTKTAGADAPAGDDELAALRAQLGEAQRRGDLQAIERQALLEQLEQAEDRIASLEEQLDDDAAARASAEGVGPELSSEPGASEIGPRMDALLARERTLRWELGRARGEIERLEARPIDEAEAEIAALRADLDQARAELEAALADHPPASSEEPEELEAIEPDELDALAELAWLLDEAADAPSTAQTREWERARSTLEHLLRKLERGASLSALELHRQLATLKRLL